MYRSFMLNEGNVAEVTGAKSFKNKLVNFYNPPRFFRWDEKRGNKDCRVKGIKVVKKINHEMSDFHDVLTGTAEVTPVSQIDSYKFKVCEVITGLNDTYQKVVRKDTAA